MVVSVELSCRFCGRVFIIHIDVNDLEKYKNGANVQDAFPYLTADERELIISNTCGKC